MQYPSREYPEVPEVAALNEKPGDLDRLKQKQRHTLHIKENNKNKIAKPSFLSYIPLAFLCLNDK